VRIAHLVTSGDEAGGQAVAFTLGRAARDGGHDVLFVSPTPGPFVERAAAEGFATYLVDVTRTTRWRGGEQLRRLLRRREVDVLHTHVHAAAGILGRIAARAAGAAVISHLHIENHFRPQRLPRAVLAGLDNRTSRLCARLLAVSDATRRAFELQGFPPARLETIHNGVDLAALEALPAPDLRRELGIPPEAIVLGHVGRLAPVKGQRELLEALARLRARDEAIHVLLIGADTETGGAYRQELERRAGELGIGDRVHFAGFRNGAAAAIQELDALVLPSWIEGLPLVVLEAMAYAKPVVATTVGGTAEAVVDGETGLLVPPREPDALRTALERVIADASLRAELGQAGRQRVAELFDAARMSARVLEVYADVERRR
jgi:glycosyltransferase involved in cell wall biosynthesis